MMSPFDRAGLGLLMLGCLLLFGRAWLHDHPQHDPWGPLSMSDPQGWATTRKLAALRTDLPACRAFLERSGIVAKALAPTGEGACRRADRAVIASPAQADVRLTPRGAQATCGVDAALAWWLRHSVQPAAQASLGAQVVRIEHLGTNNCRRVGGGSDGRWSEHATGNAIDVAGFVLSDGRRISVRKNWQGASDTAAFLHTVRDGACNSFATVLSPDYNAAHADHLHLDQARYSGGWSMCR